MSSLHYFLVCHEIFQKKSWNILLIRFSRWRIMFAIPAGIYSITAILFLVFGRFTMMMIDDDLVKAAWWRFQWMCFLLSSSKGWSGGVWQEGVQSKVQDYLAFLVSLFYCWPKQCSVNCYCAFKCIFVRPIGKGWSWGVWHEGEHAKVQSLLDVLDSLLFVKITIGYYKFNVNSKTW